MSQDYLNPDNTPQALGTTHQGKYLGKGPIIILVLILMAVTYAIMIAANKRAQQNVSVERDETIETAEGVAGNNIDSWLEKQPSGSINARRSVTFNGVLEEPDGEPGQVIGELDQDGRPIILNQTLQAPEEAEPTTEELLYQKYLDKRLKEHLEAGDSGAVASSWNSNSGISGGVQNTISSLAGGDEGTNPAFAIQDLLNKRLDSLPQGGEADANKQGAKKQFAQSKADPDWYLAKTRDFGLTNYEVKTGAVIPGVLLTGMNSDLPGQVIGQIRQNVYDTATGQHLLLPQGTKIYGNYDSEVTYGQNRGLVVWQRLIFPDATTIDLGGMQGSDISGYSGFKDKVNNHYGRIFGSILLLSVFNALPELVKKDNNGGGENRSADSNSSSNDSFEVVEISREQLVRNDDGTTRIVVVREEVIVPVSSSNMSSSEREVRAPVSNSGQFNERIQEQIALNNSRVGERLTEKNLEIQPTIKIRPGYEFNIIVNKDIIFDGSYQATR